MPEDRRASLWSALGAAGNPSARFDFSPSAVDGLTAADLLRGSVLDGQNEQFRGKSVLVATEDQLIAAQALVELDGVADQIVLYPPDVPLKHLSSVVEAAQVEAIVSDRAVSEAFDRTVTCYITSGFSKGAGYEERSLQRKTKWVLLSSGTTGRPKLIVHTLASLTGAIEFVGERTGSVVWSTFYDIRRYGGLQIFLRSILGGTSLVVPGLGESIGEFLLRAGLNRVTHISGTPSHWRRALMSGQANLIAPEYVRLSGEIADQAILNHLRSCYPQAAISHAFASTEAGVAFDVTDGLAGFPASTIESTPRVEMKVENQSLRVRSARTAACYLGHEGQTLKGADGFVDTGDTLKLLDGRYYFLGRRDGTINVGGLKVHPEEVEAVINQHPDVQMSLVRTKKNPVTGALVVADVVLKAPAGSLKAGVRELESNILTLCREALPPHKVPAGITFVHSLVVADSGKISRRNA